MGFFGFRFRVVLRRTLNAGGWAVITAVAFLPYPHVLIRELSAQVQVQALGGNDSMF